MVEVKKKEIHKGVGLTILEFGRHERGEGVEHFGIS